MEYTAIKLLIYIFVGENIDFEIIFILTADKNK